LVTGADGSLVVMIVPTWCGERLEGESRLAAFLKLGTVLTNTVDEVPYGTSLSVFDPYLATGQHTLMETCWISAFNDDCIDVFLDVMANALPGCAIFTHEFKGAASRVEPGATAFGLRSDHVLVELLATFAGQSALINADINDGFLPRFTPSIRLPFRRLSKPASERRYGPPHEKLRR
jgi:hypothetical protein